MASCLTLSRYAAHVGIDECGVLGVRYTGQELAACGTIWRLSQRVTLLEYLAQAQQMIEEVIEYPVCPTWIEEDNAPYTRLMHTRWKRLLAAGIKATTNISLGEATDLTGEPVLVGPVATSVTVEEELVLYHPGTTTEITPSKVTLVGGNVTFEIPRCRLVKTALADNPADGWDFDDDSNFEATVDVVRVYTDRSTQAVLVWPTGRTCCDSCDEDTGEGCIAIISTRTGFIKVIPASQTNGVWTASGWVCTCPPPYVRLNYKAGLSELSVLAMDAIIRLAHSMMPEGPCGCDLATQIWKRDRHVPDFVAPERMRVPWGFSDGAWYAWEWTQRLTQRRISVL